MLKVGGAPSARCPRRHRRPLVARLWLLCLALALAGCGRSTQPSDGVAYVSAHYEKSEHRVPMRDGALLHTVVYRPRERGQDYPILLQRTPYRAGPYGEEVRPALGPQPSFMESGYIFVYQDVRGRFQSEGEFVNMRPQLGPDGDANANADADADNARDDSAIDESTDTYDTIEWLLANIEGHNGKVGMWGISYPGFYTAAGAIDSHPALAAVSPQAPIADWFWDDMHRNGAFVLAVAFRFFARFGVPREGLVSEWPERFEFATRDGYQFYLDLGPLANANERHFHGEIGFWNDLVAHPNYDEFWQARNLLPHLRDIECAVLTVGGWFDTEDLYGPLRIYETIEANNPGIFNALVMGPWSHGGWARTTGESLGPVHFGAETSLAFRRAIELPFFEHHLKGAPAPALPEALVFETGANRWRSFDAWPPPALRPMRLFFGQQGTLSESSPPEQPRDAEAVAGAEADATAELPPHLAEAHDDYPSDPAKPVPYTEEITTGWSREYMTADQRFAARRPDVLVYQSEPLSADLTVGGPIRVRLWVSTTATDADFVVKLIDVHPGDLRDENDELSELSDYQMLVRGDAFRGRFRDSFTTPAPFASDTITEVSFELWDVLHTFRKGHRIMVQVQSSWFPLIDRNPQRYVPNIFAATEADFTRATHRVYRSAAHPSHIELGVVEAAYERVDVIEAGYQQAAASP
ncbi:CocE/NonD family hydrolase [Haliangium ochraceum]|nr:CocE/NonD family hydrolase [Haliangium ochraceum]